MQYAKSFSQKIMEAEGEGQWITTKFGHKVFIRKDKLFAKKSSAKDIIKGEQDIRNKTIEKNMDVVSYDDVKEKLGLKIDIIAPNKEIVIAELNKLPDSHKALINNIIIDNKAEIITFKTADNKIAKGLLSGQLYTNTETGETTLRVLPSIRSSIEGEERREARTVRHEVGHVIFNNMHVSRQQDWKALETAGYKPNIYSKIAPDENFAEHYRMYSEGGAQKLSIEKSTTPMQLKFLKKIFDLA